MLAVLSHGVLDGLKHGYPLEPAVDVCVAAVLALAWCVAVRPPLGLLFAFAMAGSLAPDVIDHAPIIVRSETGLPVPLNPLGPLFPWHWPEGSGSMDPGAAHRFHDLNFRRNGYVSYANHTIVLGLAAAGVFAAPWAFRFVRVPDADGP